MGFGPRTAGGVLRTGGASLAATAHVLHTATGAVLLADPGA